MAVTVKGKTTKQLQEERANLITNARSYLEQHEDDWTDDRQGQYNAMFSDAGDLKAAIERRQALEGLGQGSSQAPPVDPGDPNEGATRHGATPADPVKLVVRDGRNADGSPRYTEIDAGTRGSAEYQAAFGRYLMTGRAGDTLQPVVGANLQSDDAEQAGYLTTSEQFAAGILKEVDDLVFVRRYARIHTVREASSLGIRKRTGRLASFGWTPELTVSDNDTALKYGKKVLTPHHLTGSVKISRDLVRRSVVSAEGEVRMEMARDGGEVMEDAYLLGNGDRKPLGVFVASDDGISTSRDVLTGSATGFTADGLLDAKYALKSQYRSGQRGQVRWLYHRDAISRIAKLKDSDGQYLLRVGMGIAQDGGPPEDSLLGYPVDESERTPNTFTTGLYVGLLANWNYYEIADALDMEIQMLVELNARTNEYEYIGRLKTDGMPTLEEAFVRLKTD